MPHPPVSSRVLSVEQLFLLGSFEPASVQRDYQWRVSECLTLLDDVDRCFAMCAALAEPAMPAGEADADAIEFIAPLPATETLRSAPPLDVYMLGTIVVTCDGGDAFAIYDGMQRLTTLTVLICVLRDLTADAALAERLDTLVRVADGRVRLVLHGRDKALATQIQPRGEAIKRRSFAVRRPGARGGGAKNAGYMSSESTYDVGQRIRRAAKEFREKLKPWDSRRRDDFARFLIEQCYFNLQLANDGRLARQMFVTTNARGRPLDPIDLLKGQLSDIARDDATAQRVVDYWNAFRTELGDHFSAFLHTLDAIERSQPQGKDSLNIFAEHIAKTRGADGIEACVASLKELGSTYLALQRVLSTPPVDSLTADIWRLQFFRWPHWRPLALLWFNDLRQARAAPGPGQARRIEAAKRRFAALHRRCMGLVLAGFSAAQRETILLRATGQTKSGSNPLSPTGALAFKEEQLSRVRDALLLPLTDLEVRSTLVRWLESMLHGDVPPAYLVDTTVEHVLPRRPAKGSDWLASFDDLDARFRACHSLGNLVAIDRRRNEALNNSEFDVKLPILLDAAASYKMLADIDENARWTAEVIEARTKYYAEIAFSLLELPRSTY